MKKITFLLLLVSSIGISQTIKGKIYDNKSVIHGVKITNLSNKVTVISNENGEFTIKAKVNDSITFKSFFHEPYTLKLTNSHLNETIVIELKKIVNQLDNVYLSNEPKEKPFVAEEYQEAFHNQLKEDIKKHPYKYGLQPSNNINIVELVKLIGKLFKNKNKKDAFVNITYKQIDSLFKKDELFNDSLLISTFKIPKETKFLFFDYCEAKNIDSQLLSTNNRLQLLSEFQKSSIEFLEILKETKKN